MNKFKIPENKIEMMADIPFDEMTALFLKLKKDFKEAHGDSSKKLCLLVYYAGHGVMCNTNFTVHNEDMKEDRYFNFE